MRKVSALFAVVLGLFLFGGVANAQTFSSSSITIGNGYFGFSLQEFNSRTGNSVNIQIGNGRHGNYTGIHIQNNRQRYWRNDGFRYQRQRYVQPRRYVQPQPIQIIVWESRQVREPVFVQDRYGNWCETGRYRLVWRDVEVYKTAHWDSRYGAYVYYDSNGRLATYRR